ncbi:hypothetical protein BN2475_90119 [Paraburkholderia ribeironis]|uniref:Uncharacterized protein n=1 Tax=Paraburkholderia ribeironis TaxID=1247936 RepID=A0A1N7RNC9_9BURK|nr:hypothetical protein BN2475_90119 [Paraburkholderia ribeironis]
MRPLPAGVIQNIQKPASRAEGRKALPQMSGIRWGPVRAGQGEQAVIMKSGRRRVAGVSATLVS